MKRGRPVTRIGLITRGVFKGVKSTRTLGNKMAAMRAFDRMHFDGQTELAEWFMDNRRELVLTALGRIAECYITSMAHHLRTLKYADGSGPLKGWEMLEELPIAYTAARESEARALSDPRVFDI